MERILIGVLSLFVAAGCSSLKRGERVNPSSIIWPVAGTIVALGIADAFKTSSKASVQSEANRLNASLAAARTLCGDGGKVNVTTSEGHANIDVNSNVKCRPEDATSISSQPVEQAPVTVSPYAVCDRWPFLSRARLDCRRTVYRELERANQRAARDAARDAAREAIERGGY